MALSPAQALRLPRLGECDDLAVDFPGPGAGRAGHMLPRAGPVLPIAGGEKREPLSLVPILPVFDGEVVIRGIVETIGHLTDHSFTLHPCPGHLGSTHIEGDR